MELLSRLVEVIQYCRVKVRAWGFLGGLENNHAAMF
jgi:hypothetical protein